MTVTAAQTPAQKQVFLDFPRELYKDDPNWVGPLDMELKALFNPKKNPHFAEGEAQWWIALDARGRCVGRLATFIYYPKARRYVVPTGGMGFFECVEDYTVAEALLSQGQAWLEARGMEAADACINFGENDRFWGVLIEGFDTPPSYGMPYNKPYYAEFLTRYGFELYFRQESRELDLRQIPERIIRIAQRAAQKEGVTFAYPDMRNLRKYALDFMTIYNDAWQFHEHFVPLSEERVMRLVENLKPILIEEMIYFAYVDNEPAGLILAIPDLNQIFRPWRGRPTLWQLIQFLWRKRNKYAWYRQRKILTRARVMLMGVRPKYQKRGLESALAYLPVPPVIEMGITHAELSWVGDFNPAMLAILEATQARRSRVHATFRYYFTEAARQRAHAAERAIIMRPS
ncbi:MAG: GNAT family N-acetyltransferase [Bacteroidia bacterium]|nr:GNAT family N-acetyltransferase [Bacteroidia bacterium]MCX7764745.1 GNAT family N-acetyltransferase [Bacteroidia bacterium]MDW8058156.1 GNAT family N-acetyltransferase [Bacteroidia bacterium]